LPPPRPGVHGKPQEPASLCRERKHPFWQKGDAKKRGKSTDGRQKCPRKKKNGQNWKMSKKNDIFNLVPGKGNQERVPKKKKKPSQWGGKILNQDDFAKGKVGQGKKAEKGALKTASSRARKGKEN